MRCPIRCSPPPKATRTSKSTKPLCSISVLRSGRPFGIRIITQRHVISVPASTRASLLLRHQLARSLYPTCGTEQFPSCSRKRIEASGAEPKLRAGEALVANGLLNCGPGVLEGTARTGKTIQPNKTHRLLQHSRMNKQQHQDERATILPSEMLCNSGCSPNTCSSSECNLPTCYHTK